MTIAFREWRCGLVLADRLTRLDYSVVAARNIEAGTAKYALKRNLLAVKPVREAVVGAEDGSGSRQPHASL